LVVLYGQFMMHGQRNIKLWQNKFVKLVHLVGFIIKKFVTMHGHTNVQISSSNRVNTVHEKCHYMKQLQASC